MAHLVSLIFLALASVAAGQTCFTPVAECAADASKCVPTAAATTPADEITQVENQYASMSGISDDCANLERWRFPGCYLSGSPEKRELTGNRPPVPETKWRELLRKNFADRADNMLKPIAEMKTAHAEALFPEANPKAGLRAISLANLQRALKFMEDLVEHGGELRDSKKMLKNNVCNRAFRDPEYLPVEELTMHHVNSFLVKPATAVGKASFASMVRLGSENIEPHHFISHNWGGAFQAFVATVEAHFNEHYSNSDKRNAENTYYWVCTFANNQHNVMEELGDAKDPNYKVEDGPFAEAIKRVKQRTASADGVAGQVLAIQDDAKPDRFTLSRGWCVFELHFAMEQQVPVWFGCGTQKALVAPGGAGGVLSHYEPEKKKCTCALVDKFIAWTFDQAGISNADELEKIKQYITSDAHNLCPAPNHKEGMACLAEKLQGRFSCLPNAGGHGTCPAVRPSAAATKNKMLGPLNPYFSMIRHWGSRVNHFLAIKNAKAKSKKGSFRAVSARLLRKNTN